MDIQLNYAVLGEGFPLVLLHGNGDDLTYFRNQMEPFARHFQVIALETRGHGQSPRGTGPFTLDRFADDLRDFLDSASELTSRRTAGEIKIRSTVNVREMQKQLDQQSKELRELDEKIQEANWLTELV